MAKRGAPTIPDEVWKRVLPILREEIGPGRKLTAAAVAQKVGRTASSVSQWRDDKVRPTAEALIATMQALGHDPAHIVPELVFTIRGTIDPIDEAVLFLAYETPLKATAYVGAAIAIKKESQHKGAPPTFSQAVERIRREVGEVPPELDS